MNHRKRRERLSKTTSHKEAMIANMLKSLIVHESIETTLAKAKVLKRYADKMITLAKQSTLSSRRRAVAKLRIRFNYLNPKEARRARTGDLSVYNDDRKVVGKLFGPLALRFKERNGGYTRIIKTDRRVGDASSMCLIQYLNAGPVEGGE